MKSIKFLSVMFLSALSSTVTKTELHQQTQETATQEQHYKQYVEQSKAMLTPEVATCFNNLGFYFYDDMGSEARTVYTRLQENTLEFSYTTLIPALIQLVDLADKKSILERVAPAVQSYFAQLAAQEAKKHENEKTRAHGSGYSDIPYVLNLLVDQALQVGSYLAVNGVAVINKLAVLEALRLPGNSICGDALIDNSVPDCKLQTITTPGKVANSATTATSNNTPNTIVLRDASGNFSAGTITANLNGTATNALNFTGELAGDVTGPQNATVVAFVGGQPAADVAQATIAVENATPNNEMGTLVQRDGSGSFAAENITLDGNISVAENVTVAGNIDITQNPSTATAGNILKGGDLFIHNIGSDTNIFVGLNSGIVTTGVRNTALGLNTLNDNADGSNNTAVGYNVLPANISGSNNTAVGHVALLSNNTGSNNVAVGNGALQGNDTGNRNTAVGDIVLLSNNTGSDNVAVGYNALELGTQSKNTVVGANALSDLTTGTLNTAIGFGAGLSVKTGSNNIYIGANVGPSGLDDESDTIRIGIQGTQTDTFIAGIFNTPVVGGDQVLVNASGQLGTAMSSRRYKESIAPMADDTQRLLELEPVTFTYKGKDSGKQYGLIAEDVAEKFPELVIYKDGQPESVRYHLIAVMLLNEVKKLANRVDKQQEVITTYAEQIRQLRSLITKLS